jgi:hypothetical protein
MIRLVWAFLALSGALLAGISGLAGALSIIPTTVSVFGVVLGVVFVWEGGGNCDS